MRDILETMMSPAARVDPLFLEFQLAVAGRYSIDRELGRGGMGVVYLARDVQLDRPVAIKLLPPERALDAALRERFVREARLAAKLSHPNIIPIFAVDETDGFVFYVMAYVDGETLGERVRARGPMAASEATRVLREVAWALGHAHGQGVVHRDVKPDNIMLERGTGRALVTDFGIAAALGADAGPEVAGTPEYMSPEQALGGELDARSDLYGLGATAYFLCAGRPPFSGSRAVDVLAKQVATAVPALSTVGAAVPRKLAHLIEKCLAKEPAQRPASAQHLAEQLTLAVEQRREVPAALRAFVKRDGRFTGGGALVIGYVSLAAAVPIAVGLGPVLGVGVMAATLLGIPFTAMTLGARNLIKRGFSLADVGSAFESEIEQLREEFSTSGRVERKGLEKAAGITAMSAGFSMMALMAVSVTATGEIDGASLAANLIPVAGLTTLGALSVRQVLRARRPHSSPESWAKIWLGRAGRAAFALARKLGARPAAGASTTHRATEMAIGMAAGELFASLPKVTQKALGDVPGIVNNLQKDAASLRTRLDQLNESLADAGDAATGPEYAELRGVRDELASRHRHVITTLETTRLNLLRLHAGAATVDGLTTHFDLADEVSHEVRRLLEARGEVERYLTLPSPARPTSR